MLDVLQPAASGVALGAMYALTGVAFVLVHNVTGVINFATGEYVMIGAMVATSASAAGWPLPLVFVAATLAAAAVGAVAERVTIRPVRHATVLTLILVTIGVSIALQGAALLVWGVRPRRYGPFTSGPPLDLAGVRLSRQSVWVLALTAVAALALWAFFRTTVGKAMRACEMQPEAARLQGISPSRMSFYAFTIAAAIAGSAGMVFVPITSASYSMGLPLALKGFIAA
ncbi:MAG: branched-chain amino acid ABC transporter permease, partial [Acidimicrobiales bacterium]